MAPDRSPVSRDDPEESGTVEILRPEGMLPRLPPTVDVKEENRELVMDIAENLFPGVYAISDLKKGEREKWIILSCDILREKNKAELTASIEAIAKVLDPAVQAEIEDTLLKRNFFFEQEEKRSENEGEEREQRKKRELETHQENLEDQRQARSERTDRWQHKKAERKRKLELNERLQTLTEEERRTKMKNSSRRENLFTGMAAVTFLCAAVGFAVGLLNGAEWVAGGSGATGLIALVAIVKLLLAERVQSSPVDVPSSSIGA